ncbi:MAG TPA: hypothetical protein VLY46_03815 [Usitatibacter sp.]|nr:hypothetical protein [Usitatibacter sp.]
MTNVRTKTLLAVLLAAVAGGVSAQMYGPSGGTEIARAETQDLQRAPRGAKIETTCTEAVAVAVDPAR